MKISFIIVTYNNQDIVDETINSIYNQKYGHYCINIIDNNSRDKDYILKYQDNPQTNLFLLNDNCGYSSGNNIGIENSIDSSDFLIVINPDVVLPNTFCNNLIAISKKLKQHQLKFGIIGPKLLKLKGRNSSSFIDSAGIFQSWYGKWYDRGQNSIDDGKYDIELAENVPAICGALMILNPSALKMARLNKNEYFKDSFFMYKEDIDLSLRIKSHGFGIFYVSDLVAYHRRGWKNRCDMPKWSKIMSARNELEINKNRGWIKSAYSKIKLILANLDF